MLVGLDGKVEAGFQGCSAIVGLHFTEYRVVVRGVYHDVDETVVLGRRPHHGGAADVDILNGVFQAAVRPGYRGLEGIQVYYYHIDSVYTVLGHHAVILSASGKNATVNFGVQGLDPPVHHFRKAGVVRYLSDLQTVFL